MNIVSPEHIAPRPGPGAGRAALLAFLRSESTAGLALIASASLALLWSNSPFAGLYFRLLALPFGLHIAGYTLALPLDHWVNEALMALFFLMVALEIRRELTVGHLSSRREAAAPVLAAVGGMVAPALIFLAFTHSDPAALRGWAVPVATDIAFALAALRVLGARVPLGLKVFLTALAIIDDLIAIAVIALFYTDRLNFAALLAAAVVWGVLFALKRAGVRALGPYLLGGAALWICVLQSGVHPTLAGVALAFVVPATVGEGVRESNPAHRLEHALAGWVTWGVLPLFGLANAGLRLEALSMADLTRPVVLGTMLGLVLGKQIGVFGATMAAVRSGLARMPAGLTPMQLYGGSLLCGIGFTMSLFIGDLSFHGTPFHAQVKLAVFLGSLISALLGLLVLARATVRNHGRPAFVAWHDRK